VLIRTGRLLFSDMARIALKGRNRFWFLAVGAGLILAGCSAAEAQHPFATWDPSGRTAQEARLAGTLVVEGKCAFVLVDEAELFSVAFPNETVWDQKSQTLTLSGVVVEVGDFLVGGGGGGTVPDTSSCDVDFFLHSLQKN